MNKAAKIALATGSVAAVIGGAILLRRALEGDTLGPPSVYISASEGGQIGGDYPASESAYVFTEPETIHVGPAAAATGYNFKGWYLNSQLLSASAEVDVLINRKNLLLAAVFVSASGVIPTSIVATQQIVYPTHYLEVWKSGYDASGFDHFHVGTRADRWEKQLKTAIIRYRIVDTYGNGVPNCNVNFSITAHDVNEPAFSQIAVMHPNGWIWYADATPVTFISDSAGFINVPVVFAWIPPDPKTDYGNIVKGKYSGGLFPVAHLATVGGASGVNYEVVDDNSKFGGVFSEAWWSDLRWLTGPFPGVGNPQTPQNQQVLVYTSPIVIATATYTEYSQITNSQVAVIGRVYMPPNQNLAIYNGDYK